jgi:DNA helicase HerA-like ATPase
MQNRFYFVNVFCGTLLSAHISGHVKQNEFVVFEECQTYIPNGCLRSLKKYGAVLNLVTTGANFGLRFDLITQFASMVDKTLVKMCQQRYFGWSHEKNDISYARGFLTREWVDLLPSLQTGEFIYQKREETRKIRVPFEEKAYASYKSYFETDNRTSTMYIKE